MVAPSSSGPDPSIPRSEVDALRARWITDSNDLGLGVYNPTTSEIHVGNFDSHGGHDLFLQNLGVTDHNDWRGFVVVSDGQVINNSGLNVGSGYRQGMPPADFQRVWMHCNEQV